MRETKTGTLKKGTKKKSM